MTRFCRGRSGFRFFALALLLLVSANSAAEIPGRCRSVVYKDNTLWLMEPDGSASTRLTHDNNPKYTIGGLSPDGKRIAYVEDIQVSDGSAVSKQNIVLIDTRGTLLSSISLHTVEPIIGLS